MKKETNKFGSMKYYSDTLPMYQGNEQPNTDINCLYYSIYKIKLHCAVHHILKRICPQCGLFRTIKLKAVLRRVLIRLIFVSARNLD